MAHRMLRTGWTSCTWLTWAIGPIASPRYQAKNPRYIDTMQRYAKASHCTGVAVGACWVTDATVSAVISGADSTKAQDTACHAPSSRASSPPSAYPIAAARTAPNSSTSDQWRDPRPPFCRAANATTAAAPSDAKIQNVRETLSLPRRTAITAVAAGSRPMTTAPWLAGAVVNAYEVSSGNPATTPPATTTNRTHWALVGHACRVTARATTAKTVATTARPDPMNNGDSPSWAASRVKGTVNENAVMPTSPQPKPERLVWTDSTGGREAIALLCCVMNNDSASRIVEALRSRVAAAPPGARLPSNRELVAQYGASPVTVQKAMRQLATLGIVESRPGVGTFVRAVRSARPADFGWQTAALGSPRSRTSGLSSTQRASVPDAIQLHSGYPARDLLPERLVRGALTRAARTEAALTRSPAAGMAELQAWFASQVAATTPPGVVPPSPRDALIIAGSQSGLSSIFRALVGRGQPLVIESPTYWGAILAAQQAGVVLVPVPSGPAGPDPDEVDRAFADTGARAFYAQPNFANPTGAQWSPETGQAVLDIVRDRGAFLIEDDWAHDLGIDAEPRPLVGHDGDGHVIYLRSLTKSVSPALRVAAVIARGPARDRILADRAAETMYVSGLLQAAALDVVTQPGWTTHLRTMRHHLKTRRNLLIQSLHHASAELHIQQAPPGGLNLWVRLPDGTPVDHLVRECEARGLVIAPGLEWFPAEPSGPFIRLNYSAADPARFPEAGHILAAALTAL